MRKLKLINIATLASQWKNLKVTLGSKSVSLVETFIIEKGFFETQFFLVFKNNFNNVLNKLFV
jgi:hypothetical protein